ncbi:MAG TPA: glycosyltransferase family 39 protein [Thermomicrobiales bacterium]|nr:glycosyltransferase family 39 protein [Thermomicrobiales bacterium]
MPRPFPIRISPLDIVLPLALFAITLWHLLPAVETTPFHRDEARWVHRVYYLREWRDPLGPRWQDSGYDVGTGSWDERFRMSGQPPLAPYLFGLGLLAQGRDLTTNGFWNMDRDDAWNTAEGNMPDPADLRAARRTNVVIAGLIVVAAYLLGSHLINRTGGVAGAIVLIFHPLLSDAATRAWADPALVLCVALAALAAYALGQHPTWPRALLLGALLGLGGAAKLSPLPVAVGMAGAGLLLLILGRQSTRSASLTRVSEQIRPGMPATDVRRLGWMLLTLPVVAWFTFVAAYPYLWINPVTQTYRLFDFRADSFTSQGHAWPNAAVETRTEALDRVWTLLTARWASTGGWLADRLGTGLPLRYADLLLAIAGAAMLILLVRRRGLASGTGLATLLLSGHVALTILAMRVDYARYHLPIVLTVAVCCGVFIGTAWQVVSAHAASYRSWPILKPSVPTSER